MIELLRVSSENKDFIELVQHLDADLAIRDGEEHSFYSQYNKLDSIKHCIVAYEDNIPVGCGALKLFAPEIFEVKRMFTLPSHRGKGVASKLLSELEKWASELSAKKCILETGKKQPEAIELYKRNGYIRTQNYGQYANVENSLCFEKLLK